MPETRPSRGVALPRTGQVVALVAAFGAFWILWSEAHEQLAPKGPAFLLQSANERRLKIDALVERGTSSIPELIALLTDAEPNMRRDALFGLERLGTDAGMAVGPVRERLSDENPRVREFALLALARISENPDEVIAAAAEQLVDSSDEVRETAVRRLESMGSRVIPFMIELAGRNHPLARRQAVRILKSADGRRDPNEVTAVLRNLLDDPVAAVRADAVRAIVARGAATAEDVRRCLREGNPALVEPALRAVFSLGPAAVTLLPELVALLDTDGAPPQLICGALGSLKAAARAAVPALLRRCESLADADCLHAIRALLEIGADSDQVTPLLNRLLSSSALNIRLDAARSLVRNDREEARRRVRRIIVELEADESTIDYSQVYLLVALGPAADEAVPVLIRLLSHADPAVRTNAIVALEKIGPPAARAVPELVSLLDTRNRRAPFSTVVRALGGIGPASRRVVPVLLPILNQSGNSRGHAAMSRANANGVEADVIWALGRIGDGSPEVLSALRRLLTVGDSSHRPQELAEYRVLALQSLVLLDPDPQAMMRICLPFVDGYFWILRSQAALAIGGCVKADRRKAIAPLSAALNDEEWIVQTCAALALGQIGPDAKTAAPLLQAMSRDHRNEVPNRWRTQVPVPDLLFVPGSEDLGRLSVAAAARWALAAIDPEGAERADDAEPSVKETRAP